MPQLSGPISDLPIFKVLPDQGGYTAPISNGAMTTALEGGMGFYRADQLGASSKIGWAYTTDAAGYDYIMAFYRETIDNGSQPFTMLLMFETSKPELYVCNFVPETLELAKIEGLTYVVNATVEAVPAQNRSVADAAILAAYVPPTDWTDMFNEFEAGTYVGGGE